MSTASLVYQFGQASLAQDAVTQRVTPVLGSKAPVIGQQGLMTNRGSPVEAQGPAPGAEAAALSFEYGRHEQTLPRQLSPAILTILLEDLQEFNGVSYRTVPLRTFRGKFIGIYFGSIEDKECEIFLEHLRGFYTIMNHKFECILVSFDSSEEAYTRHTQLTGWPFFPRGDLRASLLSRHFDVRQCPTLVILDANGIVVTTNAVQQILEDRSGFPWTERVIDSLYSFPFTEQVGNRRIGLQSVLQELRLPPVCGIAAHEHAVVGLLFGELWCPDTRELVGRLEFMLKSYKQRNHGRLMESNEKAHVIIYYVHCDMIDKYVSLLNFQVPFVSVRITDEFCRQTIHHFFNVTEQPKLCIISPSDGWVVDDGAGWLKRDPTGICFPWHPAHNPSSGAADGFINCLSQLSEEDLSTRLLGGPVFVAFLGSALTQRAQVVATLRAAAAAYIVRANDRSTVVEDENINLVDALGSRLHSPENNDSPTAQHRLLESIQKEASRPTSADERKRGSGPEGKVLWKVLQHAVERQTSAHGTAPWNTPSIAPRAQRRLAMSFLYSTQEDDTTELLKKFCPCDARLLHQHQMWRRSMATAEYKENQLRAQMISQFEEFAADINAPLSAMQASSEAMPGASSGSLQLPGIKGAVRALSPEASDDDDDDDDLDTEDKRDEEKVSRSPYIPQAQYAAVNKLTEELLGDNFAVSGCAMIIDVIQGVYYICGDLLDENSILRFLDAWDQSTLDPFEIRLPNPEEMIKDDEHDVAREMAMYSQHVSGMIQDNMNVIPGIVVWIPSSQHSASHMGPDRIFRALLNLAFQRCPREDRINNFLMSGPVDPDDEEAGSTSTRFTPFIEKFWIFGLLDTPDAQAETDGGSWEPPHPPFLAGLYNYVDDLVQNQQADKYEEENELDRRLRKSSRRSLHKHANEDVLISPSSDLVDEGLQELRSSFQESHAIAGNNHICMRTAHTRRALHAALLDELGYHSLMQHLPPPLFVLFVGDLPPVDMMPWPSVLQATHLHVLGSVPSVCAYREISPAITHQSWGSWAESLDDRISPTISRHIAVPWA